MPAQSASNRSNNSLRAERTEALIITPGREPGDGGAVSAPATRREQQSLQPLPIRLVHWLNAFFLILMGGSGLQILAAYPSLGPQGEQ